MSSIFSRAAVAGFAAAACALLAGCDASGLAQGPGRSEQSISNGTLAEMDKIGTTPQAPVLIRTYKKEAEFEIWKMKSDGRYALLKTYPMCRWSGQLGPKTREGDRQVPEGFYPITPAQMNPNSNYYLSFNVGYPNAYDRAFGRTGGTIMVHGACSSAGCFSMTDAQIADIYAIAREAFRGGQGEIQMQSYPFHMTAENLAKYRLDPNIDFWKQLKNGADHFEVAKTEPSVLVCGRRYVFGATAEGEVNASAVCPQLQRDDQTEQAVAEREQQDDAKVAELVSEGVKPVHTVYADGGQNPAFSSMDGVSRPDALVQGPTDIALDVSDQPVPAVMKVADVASHNAAAAKVEVASVDADKTDTVRPAANAEAPAPKATTDLSKTASIRPANAPTIAPGAVALATAPAPASGGGPLQFVGGGIDRINPFHSERASAPLALIVAASSDATPPTPPRRAVALHPVVGVKAAHVAASPVPQPRPVEAQPAD